jgi:hypothetical protein
MSRKRRPDDAGINMMQRKEDFLFEQANRNKVAEDDDEDEEGDGNGNNNTTSNLNERSILRADESVLRERKIVRARRPSGIPSRSSDNNGGDGGDTSILLNSSEETKPAFNNPFAGLSFGTSAPSSNTSFSKPTPSNNNASFTSPPSMIGTSNGKSSTSTITTPTTSSSSNNKTTARIAMNKSFLNHIQQLVRENPSVSLEDAIGEYLTYNSEIGKESTLSSSSMDSTTNSTSSLIPTTSKTATTTNNTNSSIFNMPLPSSTTNITTTSNPTPSIFSAPPPTSIFGAAPTSLLFGNTAGANSNSGLFGNFPGSSIFTGKPSAANMMMAPHDDGEDGGEDGGPDEPEEPTVAVVKAKNEEEEEIVQVDPGRVTTYRTESKEWIGKGKGRLQVLRDKKTLKYRVVVNADTTGKVMFNAPLNSSIRPSLKRADKKSITLILQSFSPSPDNPMELVADNEGKPALYCITVKDEKTCDTVFAALEKATS